MSFAPELVDDVEMSQAEAPGVLRPRPPLRFLTPRQKSARLFLIAALARRTRCNSR